MAVTGIHQVPADFVTAQHDAVFGDSTSRRSRSGWWRKLSTIDAIAAG